MCVCVCALARLQIYNTYNEWSTIPLPNASQFIHSRLLIERMVHGVNIKPKTNIYKLISKSLQCSIHLELIHLGISGSLLFNDSETSSCLKILYIYYMRTTVQEYPPQA